MSSESVDLIKEKWEKYESLCERLGDENISVMIRELGERLIMCPYNRKSDEVCNGPGGLVDFSIRLAHLMRSLNESLGFKISSAKIIKTALLHGVGKIGDLEDAYFVEQESDWHREKLGHLYQINENIRKMSLSHRSLYLLQSFSVTLEQDEWIAIQLSAGPHYDENKFYVNHEPKLAILLQTAKRALEINN